MWEMRELVELWRVASLRGEDEAGDGSMGGAWVVAGLRDSWPSIRVRNGSRCDNLVIAP